MSSAFEQALQKYADVVVKIGLNLQPGQRLLKEKVLAEETDIVYAHAEEWWQTQWSHGGRKRLETIERLGGVATLQRFKTAVFEKLQPMRAADGIHQRFRVLYTVARKPAV